MTTNAHAADGRAVKAVIPAAGLATRFLPATKAVPKELLPVVDRPVLQYIVEEAAAAGLTDVLLVTGRGKTSMVDHFDRRPDVEARLEEKGDTKRLAAVRRTSELADIYTCRQGEALGLGHAVGVAASHVGDNPFAVLLGDEFVDESQDRKSTRLNSSHANISYAAFCLKKKRTCRRRPTSSRRTPRSGQRGRSRTGRSCRRQLPGCAAGSGRCRIGSSGWPLTPRSRSWP